jgi:tetratricopeptide (TPR) repeat protein
MSYTLRSLSGLAEPIAVPSDKADDDDWLEAAERLLEAALRSYNASIQHLRSLRVSEALTEADRAATLCPYSPRILEYAALLALRHGSLSKAWVYAGHLKALDMDEKGDELRDQIARAAAHWNDLRNDSAALRLKYSDENVEVSFRELLLLLNRFGGNLAEGEKRHLVRFGLYTKELSDTVTPPAPVNIQWYRYWRSAAVALLIISIGTTALALRPPAHGSVESSTPPGGMTSPIEITHPANESGEITLAEASLRYVTEAIALPSLIEILATLTPADNEQAAAIAQFRSRVAEDLFAKASTSWNLRDYQATFELLLPIREIEVRRDREKLYRLGISADEISADSIAASALLASIEPVGDPPPYFLAEALYRLALRGPEEHRRELAVELASRFPGSTYINSRIRRLLDND